LADKINGKCDEQQETYVSTKFQKKIVPFQQEFST